MRGKSKKIEPSEDLRTASGPPLFGERLIVVALCGMVSSVPLVYLPGIFEYALLPRLFALHLCVALACLGWLLQTHWGRDLRLTFSPLLLPSLCLTGVALLSSPSTTHPLDTAVELLNQAVLIALLFLAANALSLQSFQPVLWAGAVAGLAVALVGILQYHNLAFLDIPSAALPSATFGNRNFAAMYLVCAIPLSGLLFLTSPRRPGRVLSGLSTTLMAVYLVYTRTRSAWVGLLAALLCLGVLLAFWPALRRPVWEAIRPQMDRRRQRLTLGFLALFLILSALPAHRPIADLSRQGLPYLAESKADVVATAASLFQRDPGANERLAAWRATLRMVMDHPLLGVGPGGWIRAYPPYDGGATNAADTVMNNPHNDYVWIAAEYGLIGLGVYLWLLAAGLRCLLKMAQGPDPPARIAALMFSLSLLASLGDAFFNFPREQPQAVTFLYLLFGIAASATRPHPPSTPKQTPLLPFHLSLPWRSRPLPSPEGGEVSLLPLSHRGRGWGGGVRFLPYLLLILSLTALELDRRRIGFDRHYLRAVSSTPLPGGGPAVLAEVQRALGYGAFRPHLFNLKGHALQGLGRYAEAGEAYRQALTYAPHSWHAHNGLCAVAIRQGRAEDALRHGQDALSLCPTFAEARNNLGSALAGKGDLDAAIREYREAIRLKPDFAEAHNNLGSALRARGDLDAAVEACRRALRIKPDLVEAHYNLGGILKARGDLDAAVQAYRTAIQVRPDFAEAHYNLGLVLKAKGDLDAAVREYREAIRLKPDFPEARNNLGSALARKGDLDAAVREYREAIRLKPDFPEARHNLDLLLKARKDRADAREAF